MVIWFIDHVQVVTTYKYNTLADFHTTNHTTLNLLSVLSLVFITSLNNGYSSAMFSLSVSWQRIWIQDDTPDIPVLKNTKSSNHTLSLHRLTSNSSSTTNYPWLFPTDNWLNSHSRTLSCTPLYSHSPDWLVDQICYNIIENVFLPSPVLGQNYNIKILIDPSNLWQS
jgi:hypothetical protein